MVIFRFYLVCVIREADFVKYMFSFVLYGFHLVRWVLPLSMPQCILKPLGQVLHQLLAAGEQNSLVVSRISSQRCSSDRCFLLLVNCFMILQYTLPLKILCFWGHHKYLFGQLVAGPGPPGWQVAHVVPCCIARGPCYWFLLAVVKTSYSLCAWGAAGMGH